MAVPAAASVRDPGRYRPPALTGLTDLLDRPARARPQAPALITGADRARVSYRALDELADAVAARLTAAGLRPGDAVGLVSANTVEFAAALLGGARAGLVVAPVDPALPEPRMTSGLEALGVRAVLLGPTAGGAPPAAVGPGVPAWTLRVDLSPPGRRQPRWGRARALRPPRGARPANSPRGTPWCCSRRGPPTGRRWSR